VKTYRLYFMTADGNHIERVEAIEAHNDSDAIRYGQIYTGPQALELWLGSRKVLAFESHPYCPQSDRARIGRLPERAFAPVAEVA